ncbi:MAG: class I SAM-dependent methyltransferase [Pseudolabrys sp.]
MPQSGRLRVVLPSGDIIERASAVRTPEAMIEVHRWRGLWRMLRDGDPGFVDGYLDGDWSTPDLVRVLEFFMENEAAFAKPATPSWLTFVRTRLQHWARANTKRGAKRNIAAHYDLGNSFYEQWLDRGMNYSSARFERANSLEAAQEAKLARIVELMELTGGERVLEIGCGWGALAEHMLKVPGCSVTGLTLSTEQLAYARERLAAAGQRADLRLQDYRDVRGRFDRIASIEMFEAVGERYWPVYFGKIKSSLTETGAAVLQIITIDEKRYAAYRKTPDFIQRYIFPGGMLPTLTHIEQEVRRAGLKLVHCESFGDSYAETLREWRSRFLRAWPNIETLGFDQQFRRMWEYYLAYCEVGFRFGSINVSLFKLAA